MAKYYMILHKFHASCPHCDTLFVDLPVQSDEDGYYVELDTVPCADDECSVKLCSSCPRFDCECCGLPHCLKHLIQRDGSKLCRVGAPTEKESVGEAA